MPGWNKLTKEEMTASTAPDEATAWSADTIYVTGQLVRSPAGDLYECAVGPAKFLAGGYCGQDYAVDLPNVGNNPDENPTVPAMDRTAYPDYVDIDDCYVESGKLWWMKRDDNYENKYRMFAESPELVTKGSPGSVSTMSISFRADSPIWNIAVVRTNATTIRFSGPLLALENSSSEDLTDSSLQAVREWDMVVPQWQRFYNISSVYTNYVMGFGDFYIPAGAEFTLEFELDLAVHYHSPTNYTFTGGVLAGGLVHIGTTLYNTTVGIQDYSKKERDAFGNAEIKERAYTNRINYRVAVDTSKIYATKDFLASIRAKLSVYCADPALPATVIAGYYKDFSIPYESYTESIFNLDVEGL
jgi:hypothetical protein